jgi:hypothetical protein
LSTGTAASSRRPPVSAADLPRCRWRFSYGFSAENVSQLFESPLS